MTKNTVNEDGIVSAKDLSEYGRLVKLKALASERFAFRRAASRAIYEALSLEEQALVDERFGKLAMKIASQFGRSRSFPFKGSDWRTQGENNEA